MKRGLSAIAALLWLTACGGSGDDDSGPTLEGEAAIQAAVQASVSLTGAIQALLYDPADGLAVVAAATAGEPRRTARAIEFPCELGGAVDGECREEGGRTIVTSRSEDCVLFDEDLGVRVITDGVSNATFEATGICGASVPDGVDSTYQLRDYREEWISDGATIRIIESSRLDTRIQPSSEGCSINDGAAHFDGDLRLRGPGFDWALRMDDLDFAVSSQGNPCDETARVDGVLGVDDGVRGSRFSASLDDLIVDSRLAVDGVVEVAMTGPVDFDCVGAVDLATVERLALLGPCPVEGELELALGDQTSSAAFFFEGLEIDYDLDGTPDYAASGCGDESLAVCR